MDRPHASPLLSALLAVGLCASCSMLKEGVTHGLVDGHYRSLPADGKAQPVYLDVEDDSITAYSVVRTDDRRVIDTTTFTVQPLASARTPGPCTTHTYVKHGLDLDLMYVLLKYRPAAAGVPPQGNTDINGALYLGYKTERYTLSCARDLLGRHHRTVRNLGFDVGGFIGLGATAMNPTVTQDPIAID